MTLHRSSRKAVAALAAAPLKRSELGVRVEIELKDGQPPGEFRIFKAGVNTSTKGDYSFTEASQSACMAYCSKRGMKTCIDYEHASMHSTFASDPAKAGRAAGWCKLKCKDGELWATEVKWTKAALRMIEEEEFKFFSPVFAYDRETMTIAECMSIGLTNTPALDALEPLAAKDDPQPESTNMEKALQEFLASLSKQMALKADATSTDALLAIVALKNDHERLLAAVDAKSASEAIGKIEGHKANAAKVAELTAKLETQEKGAADTRRSSLIEAALTARKISPAEKPFLEKFDEVALKAYLETRSPGAVGGTTQVPVPTGVTPAMTPDQAIATLKDEDKAVARLMGKTTPDQLKALAEVKALGLTTGYVKPKAGSTDA